MPLWTIYPGSAAHPGADILTKGLARSLHDSGQPVTVVNGSEDARLQDWCAAFAIPTSGPMSLHRHNMKGPGDIVLAHPGDRRGPWALDLLTASDRIIIPVHVTQAEDNLDGLHDCLKLLDALRDNDLVEKDIARHAVLFKPATRPQGRASVPSSTTAENDTKAHTAPSAAIPDLMDPAAVEEEIADWTEQTLLRLYVEVASTRLRFTIGTSLPDAFFYLDRRDNWQQHQALWQGLAAEIHASTRCYSKPVKISSIGEQLAIRRFERETVRAKWQPRH